MDCIDKYISEFPFEIQEKLREVRKILDSVFKDCEVKMAFGVPTYFKGKNIFHFGAIKNGVSIYPTGVGMEAFANRLTNFKTSKGAFQIPLKEKLPTALIKEMAKYNLKVLAK